jgi:hypothetical protein
MRSLALVKTMLSDMLNLLTRSRSSDFERKFFKATLEVLCVASSSEAFAS